MKEEIRLFYRPGACALAPHILLYWLNRDHEIIIAPRDEGYRRINPAGAVPALQFSDGSVLTQCSAILNYLTVESDRNDLLGGDDIKQRAEVAKWSAFFTGDFHPAFFPVFGPGGYTTDDSDVSRASVREAGLMLVSKNLNTIENGLMNRNCFVGDKYTIADAYSVPMLRWAKGMLSEGLKPWPNTEVFYQSICGDGGVVSAMEAQGILA